jgi:pyruvate ferredoxin oxidoreductase alpha subunit
MRAILQGNEAAALAAKLCRVNVLAVYPITPSTRFAEKISEYIANKELEAQLILTESEHSALSACIGASATGARTCTSTSSQGLALMHEVLFVASGLRLPIVMPVGNRALSAPINIWCDHQDSISQRDTGWLQFYCENNQEVFDLVTIAFKVAENKKVLLPAMVCMDGFVLTHVAEPIEVPEQSLIDKFLPPYQPLYTLDPNKPMTFGSFCPPEYYLEFKYMVEEGMKKASELLDDVFREFKQSFRREYKKLKSYYTHDAEIILVTMGSISGTARVVARKLRAEGEKVGVISLNVYRPFPKKELLETIKNAKLLAIIDRDLSVGLAGALFTEISACLINLEKPLLTNYILGLGGRDITMKDFELIIKDSKEVIARGKVEKLPKWIGLQKELL